jgi:hypothetical protein
VHEPRDRLGFPGDLPFLLGDAAGTNQLQRHLSAEVTVPGLVDHAEATAPQFPDDLEASDDRAREQRDGLRLGLLRRGRDLREERGQRAGRDARRSTAAISGTFRHTHPRQADRGYPIGGTVCQTVH